MSSSPRGWRRQIGERHPDPYRAKAEQGLTKVREQILSLPPETLICPGHGPLTTVAEEKEHNPFF